MTSDLTTEIPGLKQAIDRERFVRDSSFLPLREIVNGIEVSPLTLRHVLTLSAIGSPFLVGGIPTGNDVAALFVVLNNPKGKFSKRILLWRVARLNIVKSLEAIDEFFSESFMDSPGGASSGGVSYYSFAASIVDIVASEYGWTESEILDVPLKRLLQYTKAIQHRMNPEAIMFNPSDRVRGDWLKEINGN